MHAFVCEIALLVSDMGYQFLVDTSTNGNTTAFSSATASSSITVNAVNDAPALSGANDFSDL